MTAIRYKWVLENYILPTLNESKYAMLQDNHPIHNTKEIKEWLDNIGMRVIDHPAQSPDLNPIENVWHLFKLEL